MTALAIVPVLAVAGCGGGSTDPTPIAAKPSAPAKKSAVAFVIPGDDADAGHTIQVKVRLKNFKIDPNAVGKAPKPGRGHLHFSLDGGRFDHPRFSGPNGKVAVQLGVDGKYSPSLTPEITYRHIPAGRHTLEVHLANNNHTSTGVEAETTVKVQ
jgi:hypothetical protein